MASARCETCGRPLGLKRPYNHLHAQAPLVNSNILCGEPNCARPAPCIWLTEEEEQQYLSGQRSFRISNHATYVRLE